MTLEYPTIQQLNEDKARLKAELAALKDAVRWIGKYSIDEHLKDFCKDVIRSWLDSEGDHSHAKTLLKVMEE